MRYIVVDLVKQIIYYKDMIFFERKKRIMAYNRYNGFV